MLSIGLFHVWLDNKAMQIGVVAPGSATTARSRIDGPIHF